MAKNAATTTLALAVLGLGLVVVAQPAKTQPGCSEVEQQMLRQYSQAFTQALMSGNLQR